MSYSLVDGFRIVVALGSSDTMEPIVSALRVADYHVVVAGSTHELFRELEEETAVLVLGRSLLRPEEAHLVRQIIERSPLTQIVLLADASQREFVSTALAEGALWFLLEPVGENDLLALVAKACVVHELSFERSALRAATSVSAQVPAFVAASTQMQDVQQKVERCAPLDSAVLLTGESGTGKSLLARRIHELSAVSRGPFVSLSCAAIPEELMEAELFGSERGAYTGAVTARPGCVELADGGTLFLDEIGDLPLRLQPKLLTFLQERTFRRIGGRQERSVTVRLLSATHQDLAGLIAAGEFREDLYYRLHVIPLVVPPLRERKDDILLLAERILRDIGERRETAPMDLTDDARQALLSYSWPGNVRELQNTLERASAFANTPWLSVADLALPETQETAHGTAVLPSLAGYRLEELEQKALTDTLAECGGDKRRAAALLGVSVKSIYNKLARFDV